MSWLKKGPPAWAKNAIASVNGWVDSKTGELLVAKAKVLQSEVDNYNGSEKQTVVEVATEAPTIAPTEAPVEPQETVEPVATEEPDEPQEEVKPVAPRTTRRGPKAK